jgi:hypothetical protein
LDLLSVLSVKPLQVTKPKERKIMKVKIQSCTRELRQTRNGVKCTGVKINNEWFNAAGDLRNLYNHEVEAEIRGKWVKLSALKVTPPTNGNGHAVQPADVIDRAYAKAKQLEPADAQARAVIFTALLTLDSRNGGGGAS